MVIKPRHDPPPPVCADCGVDTLPSRRQRRVGFRAEFYMLHDHVWERAGAPPLGHLCIGCLEQRLGRRLRPDDFTDAPINMPLHDDTPRLLARKLGRREAQPTSEVAVAGERLRSAVLCDLGLLPGQVSEEAEREKITEYLRGKVAAFVAKNK